MLHHQVTTTIPSSRDTVQWGVLDGAAPSAVTVGSGDRFQVRTLTYSPDPETREEIAPGIGALQQAFGGEAPSPGPHVLVGPIEVEGHRSGWALQIDVLDVWVAAGAGWNGVQGGLGLTPHRAGDVWDVETLVTDGSRVRLRSGITLPLRPFFGVLGVRPDPALGRLSTVPPGPFGGNIDCQELRAGTRLILPTFTDGAGVLIGDGHSCQGDGELSETAMETSMDGVLRVESLPDLQVERPVGVTPDAAIFLGFGDDLDAAVEDAVEHALLGLEQWAGLSTVDACRLMTLGCDVRITQVVNGAVGAHVMVPAAVVDQLAGWPAALRPDSLPTVG